MAFYIGEIRKMRKEFLESYQDGDYKKALILGKGILNIYVENDDMDCMEYAVDMSNLAMVYDQIHQMTAENIHIAALEIPQPIPVAG